MYSRNHQLLNNHWLTEDLLMQGYLSKFLNSIKEQVFFGKSIEKKHLCRHDKNYYFCKSNIPAINLIVGSRNMIKVSKNMSLYRIR